MPQDRPYILDTPVGSFEAPAGSTPEQRAALVDRFVQSRETGEEFPFPILSTGRNDLGAYAPVSKATGIGPTSRIDDVINVLPWLGGIVGGFAGGGKTNPAGMTGAALGGGGGEAFKQTANTLRGRINLQPQEALTRIGIEAAKQAGLEGGFRGGAKWLRSRFFPGAEFSMNTALRPGLRVGDDATDAIAGPSTLSEQFPTVDINAEVVRRRVPVTNSGLTSTRDRLRASRDTAKNMIDQAGAARPRIAGLLPEGRVDVPLGEAPTPSGAIPSFSPSHATERVPFNAQRARQGMSDEPAVTQVYGGTPAVNAAEATADVVGGPGVVRRTFSEAGVSSGPSASLIPGEGQMIGPDEILKYVRELRTDIAKTESARDLAKLDKLIGEFFPQGAVPRSIGETQAQKEASQDVAARLYRTGKGPQKAQFRQAIARGSREAVERRVPGVADVNAETQAQIAIYETLRKALNRESQSGRLSFSGLLDNPRLWGGLAHGARFGADLAEAAPQATRYGVTGADLLVPSHETPGRRRPR